MTLPQYALPFGLRQVLLTPILADGSLDGDNAIYLPASRTFSFAEAEEFEELQGDDTTVGSHGAGPVVNWSLEGGGISLEAWAIMAGGTVTSTGVSPASVLKFTKLATDARPYFQVEGRAISDSGGDFVGRVYRCKADGDLEAEMANGSFLLTSASGKGYGRVSDGKLYDWEFRETATPIEPAP